jgi:hypothetical protein
MNTMQLDRELRDLAKMIAAEEDPREASRRVSERIRRMQASGEAVPAEIERLERQLQVECIAASQGR